jgi:hypothetical protein
MIGAAGALPVMIAASRNASGQGVPAEPWMVAVVLALGVIVLGFIVFCAWRLRYE